MEDNIAFKFSIELTQGGGSDENEGKKLWLHASTWRARVQRNWPQYLTMVGTEGNFLLLLWNDQKFFLDSREVTLERVCIVVTFTVD